MQTNEEEKKIKQVINDYDLEDCKFCCWGEKSEECENCKEYSMLWIGPPIGELINDFIKLKYPS